MRGRPETELNTVERALDEIVAGFGRPHAHAGLGIRKLGRHWFECRAGLDLRLVFLAGKNRLTFHLAGNHDAVQAFLRGL